MLECIKQSIGWKSYVRGVERAESDETIVAVLENRAVGARHESNPYGGHHEATSTFFSDRVGDIVGLVACHAR